MKTHLKILAVCIVSLTLVISFSSQSRAEWPGNKPITVVIQYKAGGGTDTNTRKYCKIMEQFLGTGAIAAIVAVVVQAVFVGLAIRKLDHGAGSDAATRSAILTAHRIAAILLAVAAFAMAGARYA